MNRKLIVTLLHKNIEELNMITESFMEMEDYPASIIHIAKRKTEDIQLLIDELAGSKELRKPETIILRSENILIPTENKPKIEAPAESEITIDTVSAPETTIDTISAPEIIVVSEQKEEPKPETVESIEIVATETEIHTQESTTNNSKLTIETKQENEILTSSTATIEIEVEELKEKQEIKLEIKQPENSTETIEIKTVTEEIRKTTIADRITQPTVSRNESHSRTTDNSLSASIANKKINDIKTAISIGDRFRFQRELFRGNGEDMNKTLSYINQLATFEEVRSFLQSKYNWDEQNENVEDFYQIAKRKFI